ncbi:hypothetical protein HF576_01935 [Microbacterium sp. CFH 90308]|uniref:Uncharacterized protein n=1 Tax=Microbacterium salsuginis TaxID=2722803 RepID=A0ABX1K969_9MICO|nr:hypothetical protein [Microbacterium sp. CFH 90308]NLP82599.1 hypothetical protein [Microbacterium sp. CFH 90308]
MASRACLVAVNRTIRAGGLAEDGVHAALIDMARNLARRMDKAGPEEAPLNLLRLYDSAVTKLERAAAPRPAPKPVRAAGETEATDPVGPTSPPKLEIVEESPLDRIRRDKARAAG